MHRIVFTGAQGTGKTTVLKEFENQGLNVITEVVRQLAQTGVKINKDGDEEGQEQIFNAYIEKLKDTDMAGYISDRCLIDVTAYTLYLHKQGKVSEEFVNKQIHEMVMFMNENPDIAYCYFPIEFDVVADGVRDTDEEFRKEIDNNIRILMTQVLGMQPIVITGTVEDRVNKVQRIIDWLHEGIMLYAEGAEKLIEVQPEV